MRVLLKHKEQGGGVGGWWCVGVGVVCVREG